VDEAELAALEAKATQLQKKIDHLTSLEASGKVKFDEWMKVYTHREQLHAIYTKLIHQDRLVLHQADVEKFHLAKGTDRKLITDELKARGYAWELDVDKQEIRFWRKTPRGDWPARALDVAVVHEVGGNRVVEPVELKKESLLVGLVKGGVQGGDVEAEFKVRYKGKKALGGQLAVEDWVKDLATRAKVDRIGIKGQNIVDDAVHRVAVTPENLKKSHVSSYEKPGRQLFDSVRKSITPPKPPPPPTGKGGTGTGGAGAKPVAKPAAPKPAVPPASRGTTAPQTGTNATVGTGTGGTGTGATGTGGTGTPGVGGPAPRSGGASSPGQTAATPDRRGTLPTAKPAPASPTPGEATIEVDKTTKGGKLKRFAANGGWNKAGRIGSAGMRGKALLGQLAYIRTAINQVQKAQAGSIDPAVEAAIKVAKTLFPTADEIEANSLPISFGERGDYAKARSWLSQNADRALSEGGEPLDTMGDVLGDVWDLESALSSLETDYEFARRDVEPWYEEIKSWTSGLNDVARAALQAAKDYAYWPGAAETLFMIYSAYYDAAKDLGHLEGLLGGRISSYDSRRRDARDLRREATQLFNKWAPLWDKAWRKRTGKGAAFIWLPVPEALSP